MLGDEIKEDFINLVDEDGNEMEFEILEKLENEKGKFYALVPNFELPDVEDDDEDAYFIFRATKSEDTDDEHLEEVEDEELLDELAEIFEERFSEKFEPED